MPSLRIQRPLVRGLRFSPLLDGCLNRGDFFFELAAACKVFVLLLRESVYRVVHFFRFDDFFREGLGVGGGT